MLHENELINIEEDMILQPGFMLRRFTLNNRINGLKVSIVNTGAAVRNIQLGEKNEIVRLFGNNNLIDWNPHVLGLDTLLLNSNSNSLMYQLTTENELITIGKFRTAQQQADIVAPFYFNLNSDSDCIDGHLLHVKAVSADPESEQTPWLSPVTEQFVDIMGPEPRSLEGCADLQSNSYDSIYAATGDKFTQLIVRLSYGTKSVEVIIKSNSQANVMMDNNTNTITCRTRLRIRRSGISIMPYMMSEYHCVYKFSW